MDESQLQQRVNELEAQLFAKQEELNSALASIQFQLDQKEIAFNAALSAKDGRIAELETSYAEANNRLAASAGKLGAIHDLSAAE